MLKDYSKDYDYNKEPRTYIYTDETIIPSDIDKMVIKACKGHYSERNSNNYAIEDMKSLIGDYCGYDRDRVYIGTIYEFLYKTMCHVLKTWQLEEFFNSLFRWKNDSYGVEDICIKMANTLDCLQIIGNNGNILIDLELED